MQQSYKVSYIIATENETVTLNHKRYTMIVLEGKMNTCNVFSYVDSTIGFSVFFQHRTLNPLPGINLRLLAVEYQRRTELASHVPLTLVITSLKDL